jgi:hypothetical protein
MDNQSATLRKGETATVRLQPAADVGGVYRVTVFEELPGNGGRSQLKPVAERLVYRKPGRQLHLAVKPDHDRYVPGERATVTVTATDEQNRPAPALLMVAVVDKSVITLADEKTARSMPTHFYLTSEVRRPEDLEHADFLLGSHPQAAAALDRLLATQGWRRFAEQDPAKFRQLHRDDAERLLVTTGQASAKTINFAQQEMQRIQTETATRRAELQQQLTRAVQASQSLVAADNKFATEVRRLQKEEADAIRQQAVAVNHLDELNGNIRALGVPALGGTLLTVAAVGILIGLFRSLRRAVPYYATAVCSLLLALALTLWVSDTGGRQVGDAERVAVAPATATANQPDDFTVLKLERPPLAVRGMKEKLAAAEPLPQGRERAFRAPGAKPELGPLMERERVPEAPAAPAPPGPPMDQPALKKPLAPKGNLEALKPDGAGQLEKFGLDPQSRAGAPAPQKEAEYFRLKEDKKAAKDLNDLARVAGDRVGKPVAGPGMPGLQQKGAQPLGVAAPAGEMPVDEKRLAAEARKNAGGFGLGMPGGVGGMGGGGGRGLAGRMGGRFKEAGVNKELELPPTPIVVREYAHVRRHGVDTDLRSDFVDTLYWQPVLVLPDGKGHFAFDLCDAVTSFQITAAGHTLDGRLGAVNATLEARLPFTVEPKLPVEVTASDRIDVPVSIANNTHEARPVNVRLTPSGLSLVPGKADEPLTIAADGRARRVFRLQPTLVEGQARLLIEGTCAPFTDSVVKSLPVVPDGFPVVLARSDVLEKAAVQELTLPEKWIERTLKCQVQVYPSTLASLQQGLEALLREPNGCFEQTSTTSYPNVLILNYLKESEQARPEIERRARELLVRGYQRLTAFECPRTGERERQGYEWFGAPNSAHEALTAYGLLQFRDMAHVQDVDGAMLERTRAYLMSRRDGKGGFLRNSRALDTFGRAPDDITNAYIVWALTESGKDDDVSKELAVLSEQARSSKDPYFLALVANSLLNRGKADEGGALLRALAAAQQADGHLDAARTSITGSGGRDLQIETTALAVLAWLKANRPEFTVSVQNAVKWIGQQRGGYGGFGSTQSTILALKALIAFTKANKKTAEPGELQLFVGEQRVAHLAFPAGAQDVLTLTLPEPEQHLKPGKNTLRVEVTGKNVFPYTLSAAYRTPKPLSADGCPVRLHTRLDRPVAAEGDTVHLSVTVENVSGKGQGMTVAIVGLPAGLSLPEDMKQLKDHTRLRNDGQEPGLISFWEIKNRELVLYWRDLAPDKKIEVPLDLVCRVPGEYRGPASRAYLYYNADRKHWVEPLGMTIQPK